MDFLVEKVLVACALLSCVIFFAILTESLERILRHRVNSIQGSSYKKEICAVMHNYFSGAFWPRSSRAWLFFARLALALTGWLFLPIIHGSPVLFSKRSLIYVVTLLQVQAIFDVVLVCVFKSTFYRLTVYRSVVLSIMSCFLLLVVLIALSTWFNTTDLLIIQSSSAGLVLNICLFCAVSFTLLCKNSLLFFDFTQVTDGLDFFESSSRRNNTLKIKSLTRCVDRVFLCAFLVVLFFDYKLALHVLINDIFQLALFLFYTSLLMVFFSFLNVISPFLQSNTCLTLFRKYIVPASSIIILISIIRLYISQ